jgi:hypothetical protein
MYTSSSRIPYKKALFTSNCRKHQLLDTATERTNRIVAAFTTGLNVSSQSIPYLCLNP